MITTLRPAQVKIVLDTVTHSRLQAIALVRGISLSALVRGLCEDQAAQIDALLREWESGQFNG